MPGARIPWHLGYLGYFRSLSGAAALALFPWLLAPAIAAVYLSDIQYAQAHAPNGDELGIIAASVNGLRDCDRDDCYSSLRIGATSWYFLAALGVNPFTLF